MDQSRLNFLNLSLNFKRFFFKNYFLLEYFELEFDKIHPPRNYNNNFYKKKLDKKSNLNTALKLKKVFNNKQINNILFF